MPSPNYTPVGWVEDVTPLLPGLNTMDAGIEGAHERLDGISVMEAADGGSVPLTVRGASSQSADLFVAEDSSGIDLFKVGPDGEIQVGSIAEFMPFDTTLGKKAYVSGDFDARTSPSARNALLFMEGRAIGTSLQYPGYPSNPSYGLVVSMNDHWNVKSQTITGAADNGSGLIRLTVPGHVFVTGDKVAVGNVEGTTEANGGWIVTYVDASHVDLQGSTFVNAYTSGGKISNRPFIYGGFFSVSPLVGRLDQPDLVGTAANGSDAVGLGVFNGGVGLGTAAFNINRSSGQFPGMAMEWMGGYSVEANVIWPFRATGAIQNAGLSLEAASYVGGAHAITLPNDIPVSAENGAGDALLELFRLSSGDRLVFAPGGNLSFVDFGSAVTFQWNTLWGDGVHLNFGLSTGSKIGTAADHKFAFWGATPVVQQVLATGAGKTVDDVITLLQTLGLCKQS